MLDRRSAEFGEISDELKTAEEEAKRARRQSAWIRSKMPDVAELSVVTAIGAVGALANRPDVGAAGGALTYAVSKLVKWMKGRPAANAKVYARHLALFDTVNRASNG